MQVQRIGAVASGDGNILPLRPSAGLPRARPNVCVESAGATRLTQPVENPAPVLPPAPAEEKKHPAPFQRELRAAMMREMQKTSGLSFLALVELQKKHIASQAEAAGLSIGTYMRNLADQYGYGGTTATRWPALSPDEQQACRDRFAAVLAEFRNQAPEKLVAVIDAAEKAGGGMMFEPEKCEELDAYAYANGPTLGTGFSFLRDAENDITSIYSNVEHELNGHWKYGKTVSMDIIDAILVGLPAAERKKATEGEAELGSVYGYPETEVYAEMHEMEFRQWNSSTDSPSYDIPAKLRDLRDRFAPEVAAALVRGYRHRMQMDESVTDAARAALDRHIETVFGITFSGGDSNVESDSIR